MFAFHISALVHATSVVVGLVLLAYLGWSDNRSRRFFSLSVLTMVVFSCSILFRSLLAEQTWMVLRDSTFYLSTFSVMLGPVFFCISGLSLGREIKDYEWLIALLPIIIWFVMLLDLPIWTYDQTFGWDYRYNPLLFSIFGASPVFSIAYVIFVMYGTYKKLEDEKSKFKLMLFMVGVVLTLVLMELINAVLRMALDTPPTATTLGAAIGMSVVAYSFIKR